MSNTQKVKVQTCAYCACTVHMQSHCTTLCLSWLRSRCLNESWSIRWLTTTRTNSYQLVLVRIYRNCAILEAWLPFITCEYVSSEYYCHDVRLKFSVQDICKLWSHCSHCKHDLVSCPDPLARAKRVWCSEQHFLSHGWGRSCMM